MYFIEKYKRRTWAVYDERKNLVCVTLYKRGAEEVRRRLENLATTESQKSGKGKGRIYHECHS